MSKLRRWFHEWNQIGCFRCGCKEESTPFIEESINGIATEMLYRCKNCGAFVNYWAYGSFQYPITKTEEIRRWWYHQKYKLKGVFRK